MGLFTSKVLFSHNVTTLENFTKFRHIRKVMKRQTANSLETTSFNREFKQ